MRNYLDNRRQELSNEQVLYRAPSAGAEAPHEGVSEKYTFVPTMQVVDIMREEGWYPIHAREAGTRSIENYGVQKHIIRFAHRKYVPDVNNVGDEFVEAVMINSHNRSSAFQFYAGIYRLVCSNGMISAVGEFNRVSVRHINANADEIIEASYKVLDHAPAVMESMNDMKAIELAPAERGAFAHAALPLLYEDPEDAPFAAERLLSKRRYADKDDLWSTFNTVQENVMKGGIRGWNGNTRKRTRTRAIKSIDRDVKLNRALWTLAEEMKKIKLAA